MTLPLGFRAAALLLCLGGCDWPLRPGPVIAWSTLSSSGTQSCGIAVSGETFCVGGLWTPTDGGIEVLRTDRPTAVPGAGRLTTLVSGPGYLCGLDRERRAHCAGLNQYGQLGGGAGESELRFRPVAGDHRWTSLATGTHHACGIRTDGVAMCWGSGTSGVLGHGLASFAVFGPSIVLGGHVFTQLVAGASFTCGLRDDGTLWCWGAAGNGALADGSSADYNDYPTPREAVGGLRFRQLGAGRTFACGLTRAGKAYCWGSNFQGQLGIGTRGFNPISIPTPVAGDYVFRTLSVGGASVCGLTADRALLCWGANMFGEASARDVGGTVLLPRRRYIPEPFIDVSVGDGHACGVTGQRFAYCWGHGFDQSQHVTVLTPRLLTR